MKQIKVALVDDHVLLRKGLAGLITGFNFDVQMECDNGKDLVDKININDPPDIVLMDINMPKMDGYECTAWLTKHLPLTKVLALSMYDDENSILHMLRSGAKGYILKDANPAVLKRAIEDVINYDVYYSDFVTGKVMHSVMERGESLNNHNLSEREVEFLKLASTELTYKEIANSMCLSPRTIDGYREALFEKLNVKSRIGLVLFAIRKAIVPILVN